MRYALIPFVIGLIAVTNAQAQYSETISSDRPGATYSANTVGSRTLQLQAGGDFISETYGNSWSDQTYLGWQFDALVRVGIIERLEIGFPVYYSNRTRQHVSYGNNDPIENLIWGVNLRGNVLKSNGKTPDIGLMVEVRFPDKDTERFAESIYQLFLVNIQQPLEKRITLSSSIGMIRHSLADLVYTLNLSVAVSPKATLFIEHYGVYRTEYSRITAYNLEAEKEHIWYAKVNGGLAIQAMNDLQIDLQAGYGAMGVASYDKDDWFVGLGLSWRVRFKKREQKSDKG